MCVPGSEAFRIRLVSWTREPEVGFREIITKGHVSCAATGPPGRPREPLQGSLWRHAAAPRPGLCGGSGEWGVNPRGLAAPALWG